MKTENSAVKLLAGSRNLDRMKKEIHLLVCMLINALNGLKVFHDRGQLFDGDPFMKDFEVFFKKGRCLWTLRGTGGRFFLYCRDDRPEWASEVPPLLYSLKNGSDKMKIYDVQEVYDSLDALVDGMFEKIPKLHEVAQLYFKAADKFTD